MQSDTELLQRYVESDSQEAFAELVRRHIDLVYSAAVRRVGMDSHLAEDVTQEVFAELARKSASLLGRPTLEGWLYTTGRFKAVDLVRRSRRRREREALFMNANPMTGAEQDWEHLRPMIDEALDSLSSADREILILRYFRQKSFGELAGTLKSTEDAVRMRSTRALDRLRAVLAKRGLRSSAEALGALLTSKAIGAAPLRLAARVMDHAFLLAKAGTSAGSTLAHASNASKIVTSVAMLALLFSSIPVAIHEIRAHRDAATLLAQEELELEATTGRFRELSRKLNAAAQDESDLQSRVDGMLSALERAKSKRAGMADLSVTSRDFVQKNPKAKELIVGHDVAHGALKYAALFSSLGLSSDKQTQVLKLFAQRSDLGLSWFSAPDSSAPTAIITANAEPLSAEDVSSQLKDLLGEAGYQAYQDFDRLGPAQTLAQQLAGSLYATPTPITAAQGNQLAQILAQSSTDYQNGKSIGSTDQIDWEAAIAAAANLLTPPQMEALRALAQTTSYEQAINTASNQAAGQAVDNVRQTQTPKNGPHP